ncbi:cysteinyl-tRNA synthetase [Ceratobasidium sp. 428]|nr:cysteinyl-tRNA synthetase [Ceratobasidium sp. 428]
MTIGRHYNRELRYLNLSGSKRIVVKSSKPNQGEAGKTPATRPEQKEEEKTVHSVLGDIHVLGLIDETNLISSLPDELDDRRMLASFSDVEGVAYGISDTLGKLEQLNTFDLAVPQFRGSKHDCLFGIFMRVAPAPDSGRLARYLHENFSLFLETALERRKADGSEDVPDALRRTFLSLNKTLYDHLLPSVASARKMRQAPTIAGNKALDPSCLKASASACVAYLTKTTLYVANVGSSQVIISRDGTPFGLPRKQDPLDRTEATRIQTAGGWVSPEGLVNGESDCNESRAFGVYHLLPIVNAQPKVETWELTDRDEFVIIGNRGFWDYMAPQNAVGIVRASRARREEPTISAQILRDYAISYGAKGSIMIMVISVSDKYASATVDSGAEIQAMLALRRVALPGTNNPASQSGRHHPLPIVVPPIGQVALVFTDIVNSTHLWENYAGMRMALQDHNRLLREELKNCGGYECKTEGDAFMTSFHSAPAAFLWCLKVQKGLREIEWSPEFRDPKYLQNLRSCEADRRAGGLSVRMGIHWGAPICEEDPNTWRMDYFGPVVNRAARISSTAMGGEVMLSEAAAREIKQWIHNPDVGGDEDDEGSDIVRLVIELKDLNPTIHLVGERQLEGLDDPERLSSTLEHLAPLPV